jgi:hypothetical protein
MSFWPISCASVGVAAVDVVDAACLDAAVVGLGVVAGDVSVAAGVAESGEDGPTSVRCGSPADEGPVIAS